MQIQTSSTGNFFFSEQSVKVYISNGPLWGYCQLSGSFNKIRLAGQTDYVVDLGKLPAGYHTLDIFASGKWVASENIVVSLHKSPIKSDKFGVNTAAGKKGFNHKHDYKEIHLAQKIGGLVRDSVRWEYAEDEVFKNQTNDLIREFCPGSLCILGLGNEKYTGRHKVDVRYPGGQVVTWSPTGTPQTKEQLEKFSEYVYNLLTSSKGAIGCVEVWNEPCQSYMLDILRHKVPKVYKNIVDSVRKVVDSLAFDVKIAAGAHHKFDVGLFKEFADAGCYDSADAISFHSYPKTSSAFVWDIGGLKKRYNKEFWLTEWGFLNKPFARGVSDYEHASMISKSLVRLCAIGIDKMFMYALTNYGEETGELSDKTKHWGLVRSGPEHKPKLGLAAYCTSTYFLNNATLESIKSERDYDIYSFKSPRNKFSVICPKDFVRDGKIVHRPVSAKVTGSFTATELDGKTTIHNGSKTFSAVNGSPIYFAGDFEI